MGARLDRWQDMDQRQFPQEFSTARDADHIGPALESQADAFAQLLGLTDDPGAAFKQAAALAAGLFPHQIEGVAFLLGRRRAILADDMGLGKTRQAIVSLRHAAPNGRYLVVCPASVKWNWSREITLADPHASVAVVSGSASIDARADWVIVNYDILKKQVGTLARVPWAGLVFDEAHYLKNHTSARSRLARQLASEVAAIAPREPAVYLLTGTPLTNRPRDLFVLLQLVGHPLGRSFLSFAKRYCAAVRNDYGWTTDGASNLEELTVLLHGVMLRRSKDQVLALPQKLRTWLSVEVPAGTASAEIRNVVKLLLDRRTGPAGASSTADDARARGRLLALLTKARQKVAISKISATLDFVQGAIEQGEKVVVFSCFDEPLQTLARALGEAAVLLTGRTPANKRQPLVDRFQRDDRVRVFLANIVAGGVGINLTAATQVVFNDLDWVPANHWQAEDRAYRLGQTRTVNVTYVVGQGTVDEFVQAVLETKGALIKAVVEGEAVGGALSGDVLDELQRALRAISPGLADTSTLIEDEDLIDRLLQQASVDVRRSQPSDTGHAPAPRSASDLESLRRALEGLLKVLAGSGETRYRIASTSQAGVVYDVVATTSDVTCSCPGFEHRGQCRHAREVKTLLASGKPLPAAYMEIR
jgi:SWI/SNF-related matrix-associated actin-dependent regulator 1 of chromatin subfamily A